MGNITRAKRNTYLDEEIDVMITNSVPSGIISMWSGLVTNIPSGWLLCDGTNNTPDLRGRFVYGATNDGQVEELGGSSTAPVVAHVHAGAAHTHTANHNHTASSNSTGAHYHNGGTKNFSSVEYAYGITATDAGGVNGWNGGTYTRYLHRTSTSANHSHTITVATETLDTGAGGTNNTGSTGTDGTDANLPPYMYLAYVMKA